MRTLLIDNYDSFTFNIVHLLKELDFTEVEVKRNGAITLQELKDFDAVIGSPGPGLPEESDLLLTAVSECLTQDIPYLGICLGHQALALASGARLKQLSSVSHGVQDSCTVLKEDPIFHDVDQHFSIGRYHSWAIEESGQPVELETLARTEDGVIQAVRVKDRLAYGLQFHPESIMTKTTGRKLVYNFYQQIHSAHA